VTGSLSVFMHCSLESLLRQCFENRLKLFYEHFVALEVTWEAFESTEALLASFVSVKFFSVFW